MTFMPARFSRYVAVGFLNTCIAYGVFALLLMLGVHYAAATLAGGICAMLAGYRLMGRMVFDYSREHAFPKFILVFLAAYALNVGIQFFMRKFMNPYLSGGFASVISTVFSYLSNRKYVFGLTREL